MIANDLVTIQFLLRGLVQGQGVRPTIARIAAEHGIAGAVRNSFRGVEVTAIAQASSVNAFHVALTAEFAKASLVAEVVKTFDDPKAIDFRIIESVASEKVQTTIPLDLAVCPDCLREVRSPSNRRYAYPFTTCTRCGPRYSILKCMPFDRESTSMAAFPMCQQCEDEYRDPRNRRFHAQTIACAQCGPRCWATDSAGKRLATQSDAITIVAQLVMSGKIAAVKGIGGYQLICDATNNDAVHQLRERKRRPGKPLPVMVCDVAKAERLGEVSDAERDSLQSPANSIVMLRSFESCGIAPAVAPRLRTIGVMLPTSPMHAMLLDEIDKPIVFTSGNVHGSPLLYENENASAQLAEIADVFLHHNRAITNPVDDSVIHCFGDHVATFRAARGIAPLTLPSMPVMPSLAVGGHQKVAPAISTEGDIVLAPHIGDMETEPCRVRFEDSLDRLQKLYLIRPHQFVCDKHPDYFTSSWANEREFQTIAVQHHHAHVAAAMLDHGLGEKTVLGLAFDGTGFGDDQTIWGGEALLATKAGYERVGHLRCFRLPGGEHAIKHPRRIAQSLLSQVKGSSPDDASLRSAIELGSVTSSMGRLFDGVAAIVLDIDTVQYEGEAAMRLEACCDQDELGSYEFGIAEGSPIQFDWRPVLAAIQSDMDCLTPGRISMKFHRAVAKLVTDMAARHNSVPCVVTGGVFQNRVLLELVCDMALEHSLDIRLPGRIPVNDGGLAIGQLVVASARQHQQIGGQSCA